MTTSSTGEGRYGVSMTVLQQRVLTVVGVALTIVFGLGALEVVLSTLGDGFL